MLTHLNFYTSSMAAQLVEKNVLIRIVDSVLMIDVALFHKKIGLDQLFGEFGTATNVTLNVILQQVKHVIVKSII